MGWPGLFSFQVRGGNRAFLDRPKRFTGFAIKDKQQAVLRSLGHRIDLFTLVRDRHQHRWTRQVFVQQVMVHDLEVPDALPGRRVQGKHAVGKEVRAVPSSAVKIGFGGLGCHVDDTSFLVERLAAPGHQAGGGLVGVLGPGIVADFTGPGNEMKDPALGARAHVVGPHCALASHATHDQEVLVGHAGRVQTRTELDRTFFSEILDHLAARRVQGEENAGHGGEQSAFTSLFILPIDQATLPGPPSARAFLGRIPGPPHRSGRGIDSHHLAPGRWRVQYPIHDQVVRLILRFVPGFIAPGNL